MAFKYRRTTGTQRKAEERQRMNSMVITPMPASARNSNRAVPGKTSRSQPHVLRGLREEQKGERVMRGRALYDSMLRRIGLKGLA